MHWGANISTAHTSPDTRPTGILPLLDQVDSTAPRSGRRSGLAARLADRRGWQPDLPWGLREGPPRRRV